MISGEFIRHPLVQRLRAFITDPPQNLVSLLCHCPYPLACDLGGRVSGLIQLCVNSSGVAIAAAKMVRINIEGVDGDVDFLANASQMILTAKLLHSVEMQRSGVSICKSSFNLIINFR